MSSVSWLVTFVSGALIGAAVAYAACQWRLERHFAQEPPRLRLAANVRVLPPVRDWEREGWL